MATRSRATAARVTEGDTGGNAAGGLVFRWVAPSGLPAPKGGADGPFDDGSPRHAAPRIG